MVMDTLHRRRLYLYLAASFAAGILTAIGFREILSFPRSSRSHVHVATDRAAPKSHRSSEGEEDDGEEEGRPDIKEGIEGCIGDTPLLRIKSLSDATGCEILAKAEFLNGAGGSTKDRVALNIINTAERQGLLTPHSGDTIYEGTVGSTGISLAAICRARGYLAHICMPSDQSTEKSDLLLKLGAEVERVLPAPIADRNQFVNLARLRASEHTLDPARPGVGFFADQFENHANWLAHYHGTGPEIYRQTGGRRLDAFVAGAGTGGTISGVALFLKPRLPALRVVLADPAGSGLYNRIRFGVMFDPVERDGTRRRHQVDSLVEGIGINRVTANLEAGRHLIDDAVRVSDAQAMAMARWLAEKDGIFLGPAHTVITVLCDSGTRHLSKFWAAAAAVPPPVDLAAILDPPA
ncbi:hypothetical protein GP486_008283, partial [Trichoglossum hirsutum]